MFLSFCYDLVFDGLGLLCIPKNILSHNHVISIVLHRKCCFGKERSMDTISPREEDISNEQDFLVFVIQKHNRKTDEFHRFSVQVYCSHPWKRMDHVNFILWQGNQKLMLLIIIVPSIWLNVECSIFS